MASKFPVEGRVITAGPGAARGALAPPPPTIVTAPGDTGPRVPGTAGPDEAEAVVPEPDVDPDDTPCAEESAAPAAAPGVAPDDLGPAVEAPCGEPAGDPPGAPGAGAVDDPKPLEADVLLEEAGFELADVGPLARGFVSPADEAAPALALDPAPAASPDTWAMFPGGTTSRSGMGILRSFKERMLAGSPTGRGGGRSGALRTGGVSRGGGVRGSGSRARRLVGWGSACTSSSGAGAFSTGNCTGEGLGRPGARNGLASFGICADKMRKEGRGVAGGVRSGGDSG